MTVELISVGTEILLGNIVNTNAAYLAEKLAMLGLSCYHQSVVGDNEERLEDAVRLALSRSDIVILGGGLGPTKDDLTKEVTAKVFGKELYEDTHTRERIQEYFDRMQRKKPGAGTGPEAAVDFNYGQGKVLSSGEKGLLRLSLCRGLLRPAAGSAARGAEYRSRGCGGDSQAGGGIRALPL